MTLAEYDAWLDKSDASRCLLCELQAYSAGQKLSFYLSSSPYYTRPTDSLPNKMYEVRLMGDLYFSRSVPFFEKGRGVDEYGSIQISNVDGALDGWMDYLWKGMSVRLLLGDPTWSYADFNLRPVLTGTIAEKPTFTDETIEFKIRDKIGRLDIPLQNTLLTSGEKSGEPSPLVYGIVRNIEAIQINQALLTYKFSTGATSSILGVYDKAITLTPPPSGSYTTNLPAGEFTLTARPAGTITLDAQGVTSSGTWIKKAGELTRFILNSVGVTDSEINLTSLTTADSTKAYTLGIYIAERINVLDVLDSIWSSVGGFYYFDFEGKFTVGLLANPSGLTSKADIRCLDITNDEYSIELLNEVQYRTTLKYQKNYRVQKDGDIAGLISDPAYPNKARVDWLKTEWRTAYYEDLTVVPQEGGVYQYQLVLNPEAVETLIDESGHATTECQYRQGILGSPRRRIKFKAISSPFKLLPGDCITLYDDTRQRFGLGNGKKVQILKVTYFPLGECEIEAWF